MRILTPRRIVALVAAGLSVAVLGLLFASGSRSSCDGPCPRAPAARDGSVVADTFYLLHRGLGPDGSITVRLTGMTGIRTYPPPDHDALVPGLVPWAKTGIIIKDGTRQGSPYAALLMTGRHGVRMQHGYRHDIAGRPGGLAAPRWLRLTRAGDTVTGYESPDGRRWTRVGTAVLEGLPATARVGLFAASPGDLTLRRVAFGGALEESRFTQATGVFDNVRVHGATAGPWRGQPVGEMNHTDWERHHNPSGAVVTGGTITVSGTGDIGPVAEDAGQVPERLLAGLVIALVIVVWTAVRLGGPRTRQSPAAARTLVVRAGVLAGAVWVTGAVGVGVTLLAGVAILRGNGVPVAPVPALTYVRVVAGVAAALALVAVLSLALGVLLRRGRVAVPAALALVAVPYALAALPLLPDTVARWLLRVTPAAGFAVQQTVVEYPQVVAHYAPSAGYFPLPAWAGLAVLAGYALTALALACRRVPAGRPGRD